MVSDIFVAAKAARGEVARLSDERRNEILLKLADAIGENSDAILAAKGHGRLGHLPGQYMQSAALPTGQQHGDTLLFHRDRSAPLLHFSEFTI